MALAVGYVSPAKKEYLPLLLHAFQKDPDPLTRQYAAASLGKMGSLAKDAVPILISEYHSPKNAQEYYLRDAIISAMGNIGPAAQGAVPFLISLLKPDHHRDLPVISLGHIGPAAGPAVPFLLEELEVGIAAAQQLDQVYSGHLQLGREEKVQLGRQGNDLRLERLIRSLGQIGPASHKATPTLKLIAEGKLLKGYDGAREEAERALNEFSSVLEFFTTRGKL